LKGYECKRVGKAVLCQNTVGRFGFSTMVAWDGKDGKVVMPAGEPHIRAGRVFYHLRDKRTNKWHMVPEDDLRLATWREAMEGF
jgi:hypothetical protein